MKRLVVIALALLFPVLALAAEGGVMPYTYHGSLSNSASLQRGAKYFMNFCAGCHSLKYLRYKRVSEDLGIPKPLVMKYLNHTGQKYRGAITNAMHADQAKKWFGKAPPDLSLEARYRNADWIFNYLMTFYLDPGRSTGVNNLTFPKTAMPFPLWKLQGWQIPVYKNGKKKNGIDHLKLAKKGKLSPEKYKRVVTDITNFLVYAGEPMKTERISLGLVVMIYLVILTIILYFLKREFWRDVH